MVPKLINLSYDKNISIPLEQIFECVDISYISPSGSNNNMRYDIMRMNRNKKKIEVVRYDVLHEDNMNILVDIQYVYV